ncbi:putative Serine/threonine-protein phosphatase 2A 56 kDa regulatory subunit delta [Blattamonas nauphoetae]|uniref:Serine/threonine-protein phosphatase 2A 56 kDa regulatory subunit delta n=1 Tax=Blattamonas nauphoetae TaxID=2049346 RepID=A0ABQ9XB26_9EUKA|nr:putative Serine/threonine-protein phosphatase 2A 56 kDa regulatory subunit delta [Blattamonas nauphoetae]
MTLNTKSSDISFSPQSRGSIGSPPPLVKRTSLISNGSQKKICPVDSARFLPLHKPSQLCRNDLPYYPLPDLLLMEEAPSNQTETTLLNLLNACCMRVNWSADALVDEISDREKKARYLTSILTYSRNCIQASPQRPVFQDFVWPSVLQLCTTNLFTPLPPRDLVTDNCFDFDDADERVNQDTSHRELVYYILIQFLISPEVNPKVASQDYITRDFVSSIFTRLESSSEEEHKLVKEILFLLFARYVCHRGLIRKTVGVILSSQSNDTVRLPGIRALLDFVLSLVSGFSIPVKQDNRDFIFMYVLPLFTAPTLQTFVDVLKPIILVFAQKDESFLASLLRYLLTKWPKVSSKKQVVFLSVCEYFVAEFGVDTITHSASLDSSHSFSDLLSLFFGRIELSLASDNVNVIEMTLHLLQTTSVLSLLRKAGRKQQEQVLLMLMQMVDTQWNKSIRRDGQQFLRQFQASNTILFESVRKQHITRQAQQSDARSNIRQSSALLIQQQAEQNLRGWAAEVHFTISTHNYHYLVPSHVFTRCLSSISPHLTENMRNELSDIPLPDYVPTAALTSPRDTKSIESSLSSPENLSPLSSPSTSPNHNMVFPSPTRPVHVRSKSKLCLSHSSNQLIPEQHAINKLDGKTVPPNRSLQPNQSNLSPLASQGLLLTPLDLEPFNVEGLDDLDQTPPTPIVPKLRFSASSDGKTVIALSPTPQLEKPTRSPNGGRLSKTLKNKKSSPLPPVRRSFSSLTNKSKDLLSSPYSPLASPKRPFEQSEHPLHHLTAVKSTSHSSLSNLNSSLSLPRLDSPKTSSVSSYSPDFMSPKSDETTHHGVKKKRKKVKVDHTALSLQISPSKHSPSKRTTSPPPIRRGFSNTELTLPILGSPTRH